jgi:hypothetical protein
MSDCKPCSTPIDTKGKVSDDEDVPVDDVTTYRALAKALQYLTFQPDTVYVVQQVCLHMHTPWEPHLSDAKRILRYLCGTLDYVLLLWPSPTSKLAV